MKLIEKWKEGIEPCFRLLFVGVALNILIIPLSIAGRIEFETGALNQIIPILYVFIAVPIAMPYILKLCGFQLNKKMTEGGMNEASEEKQTSLNQETNGG